MTNQKKLDKIGATPGKLALIAVLAVVLVVVIVQQLPDSTPSSAVAQKRHKPATKPAEQNAAESIAAAVTKPTTKDKTDEIDLAPWPEINMDELLAHDPFATPVWALRQTEEVETNEPGKLDDLQKQGVSIVMIAKEGKSATIGEKAVYVGDVLEGYRITDITSQGVVLNKLDTN